MNQPAIHKKFIFNEKLDTGFIFSLYEDDYPYIIEVFTTTIQELEWAIVDLEEAFHSGNLANMRKTAHKMKPLFGFTGLLSVEDEVGKFENHCKEAEWLETMEAPYQSLLILVHEAKAIIISEQKRLKEFTVS